MKIQQPFYDGSEIAPSIGRDSIEECCQSRYPKGRAVWYCTLRRGHEGACMCEGSDVAWVKASALPAVDEGVTPNAGATPTGTPVEVGAQNLSSSLLSPVEGRQQVTEETKDDQGLPGSAGTKG